MIDRHDAGHAIQPRSGPPWHACAVDEALAAVDATDTGLTQDEAARRLAAFGPNTLPATGKWRWARRLWAQFDNALIYVLLASGAVTVFVGDLIDAAVIFGVVVINALIGFLQEGRAESALEGLKGLIAPYATVLRGGHRAEVPTAEIVCGDIVLMQAGDRIPADIRLTYVRGFRVDEAALTGESHPVEKTVAPVSENAPLAERSCMAYSGCLAVAGFAQGVVTATGSQTEMGRIGNLLVSVEPLSTPLLRQMNSFGRWLTAVILGLAGLTFLFGTFVRGLALEEMLFAAVGLAVAAIPEGLPAVLTITMAIGVQRMAQRKAVVRRLPAVETLGSVNVICSDKTGTLTRNEMVVRSVVVADDAYALAGVGYSPKGEVRNAAGTLRPPHAPVLTELTRCAVLCNDAELRAEGDEWLGLGDPTEAALLTMALKLGVDPMQERASHRRLDLIPFESERRYMATLHETGGGGRLIAVKGAPEQIFSMCASERHPEGDRAIDLAKWHDYAHQAGVRGERLLAVAARHLPAGPDNLGFSDVEYGLTLLGVVGMMDAARPEAVEAIRRMREAGVQVKVITGDHATTAAAVGRQLSLPEGQVLTGADVDLLDDHELSARLDEATIFARTEPQHKLRLVEALQRRGWVVAMTGDGVNDAPALKRADVGVAMGGRGTEAAKEASEIVLLDDNFASIAHAVEEGRTVYDNIKKAILFILPTNGGEALVLMAAILFGLTLPITPRQILWVNMISAVTLALALGFEPAEADLMRRKPRQANEPLLSRFLVWRVVFVSVLLLGGTLATFIGAIEIGLSDQMARTLAVNALVAGEVAYLWNVRYLTAPVLTVSGMFGSRPVLGAIALVLALQGLFTYWPPMQQLFESQPMSAWGWAWTAAVAVVTFLAVEAEKLLISRSSRRR